MKFTLLIATFFVALSASSLTIPQKAIGQYDAEVPAFEYIEDGETKQASGFTLSILLRETNLLYRAGTMKFRGTYTEVVQNGSFIDIKVNISNDVSVAFDLDLRFDKRAKTLTVKGITGVEEVVCERVEVVVEKKTRYKRL